MENKEFNPQMRALMVIRNLRTAFEKDYSRMNEIDENLKVYNADATLIIEQQTDLATQEKWKNQLALVNQDISRIKATLLSIKDKIENGDRTDSSDLWHTFEDAITDLENGYKTLAAIGLEGLPEAEHTHWKTDIFNTEKSIIPRIISHAESCRLQLEMVQKYTPNEISTITANIIAHIPANYAMEEAEKYEKDYKKALGEIKREFSEEKNLWDSFLDILSGGTHQNAAERVMLKRWIEGEKV